MEKTLAEKIECMDSVKENEVLTSYDLMSEYIGKTTDVWNNYSDWSNFNKWNNWPNH